MTTEPPPPPPGFTEEPEVPPPPPGFNEEPGHPGVPSPDQPTRLPAEDEPVSGFATSFERVVPGARSLDRARHRHDAEVAAELPVEEADEAARAAGQLAEEADADRRALEADLAGLAADDPRRADLAAQIETLADDAIAAGLSTSQDDLEARAAARAKDAVAAEKAEDAAQAAMGRAAHDLAAEDALRTELEGRPPT